MYHLLGAIVSRQWLGVILAWVALGGIVWTWSPRWDDCALDGDLAYLPPTMTSVRGEHLLANAFPDSKSKSQLVLVAERPDAPLSDDDLTALTRLALSVTAEGALPLPIVSLWTPRDEVFKHKLVSPDKQAALAVIHLESEFMAVQNMPAMEIVYRLVAESQADPRTPAGLNFGVSGSAAIGGDMMNAASDSIRNTEATTIAMVLLILAVVYRAPILVIIPLITITTSILVSTGLVAALTRLHLIDGWQWFEPRIFTTTRIFVTTILFGAGTDFCLFLIARYREELQAGHEPPVALSRAVGQIGEAVVGSALTTILGLGMMYFADFGKFRNSGPQIGLCLFIALVACLTLAPALLRCFGRAVFWPSPILPRSTRAANDLEGPIQRIWDRVSRQIIARPGLILVGSVLLLTPLAWHGRDVEVTYNLLTEIDERSPSVVGTNLLRRHFAPGETAPLTILAYRQGANFDTKEGEQSISDLTSNLYHVVDPQLETRVNELRGRLSRMSPGPQRDALAEQIALHEQQVRGVQQVRSLAAPLGERLGKQMSGMEIFRRTAIKRNARARSAYMSNNPEFEGDVTRLDVILKADPFSTEAASMLGALDTYLTKLANDPQSPWFGTHFDFVGLTSGIRDLQAVTASDRTLIERLVVLGVFSVLLMIVRRPLICVYLMLSVLFSYYVTIGATELFFQWWFTSYHGLDWKVPIFLFVILIAVGEDYNIYLVSRVIEEQTHHGMIEGLRRAVVSTGGIITSCGVIMAATFVSMLTGTLRGMLELGFALTVGVVLDTFIVRPILVPAFLAIVYRWQLRRLGASTDPGGSATAGHAPFGPPHATPRGLGVPAGSRLSGAPLEGR